MKLKTGQVREFVEETKRAGIMCLTRKSLMRIPLPTVDWRIAFDNNLELSTTSGRNFIPQDPLKIVPTGKSSPLTAGGREAGL